MMGLLWMAMNNTKKVYVLNFVHFFQGTDEEGWGFYFAHITL